MEAKRIVSRLLVIGLVLLITVNCRLGQVINAFNTPTPTATTTPNTVTPTPTLLPTNTPIPPDENSVVEGTLTCTYRVSAYDHSTARQYLDTGIILKQGENLAIEATGTACFDGSNKDFCNGPDGHPDFADTDLVGKIGNGEMFHIGASFQKTISNETGKLYLGFNDTDYENNSGYFDVIVIIENTPSRNCNP